MTRSSKRSTEADWDVAVTAPVLLIVASRDAEGNTAATEPQTGDETDEENDPAKSSSSLMDNSHAGLAALVAADLDWVIWEVRWVVRVWLANSGILNVDNWLWLHAWLHWLTWLHWLRVLLLRVWLCLCVGSGHRLLTSLGIWLRHRLLHHRLSIHLFSWDWLSDWSLIDEGFLFVHYEVFIRIFI